MSRSDDTVISPYIHSPVYPPISPSAPAEMDVNTFIIIYWHYRRRYKIINRKYWIHPIVSERSRLGLYRILMCQLRRDEIKFFNYFRMSMPTFDYLLRKVESSLTRQNTTMRISISPEEKLAICLRYLASGSSFKELHYYYRVGVSTISNIIVEVTQSIWNNLNNEFMQLPNTPNEWEQISDGFQTRANFPHCIGAVDGKYIRIKKPSGSGSMYFNYKDYFSIILLAVVDSDYQFRYISVGSYGKDCDSSIFKTTTFWKKLTEGALKIPKPKPLNEQLETNVPFVLVGDEGFALHENLLRPFGGTHLDKKKRIFNYRLTRARRYVECIFGIFANKWRIFHRPLDVNEETAIWIVKACTVLHNLIRKKDGFNFENLCPEVIYFNNISNAQMTRGSLSANSTRTIFANYFVSEAGSVPWQDEAVGQ